MKTYAPRARTAQALEIAMSAIKSVPYKPSARWAFYRVHQVMGLDKKEATNFTSWTSKARKTFHNGWSPDTLADSIREVFYRGEGYSTQEKWWNSYTNEQCQLNKIPDQDQHVMLWFEAKAMKEQFDYFTKEKEITLVPFGGDVSIPIKWELAKRIEEVYNVYGKKTMVLYFGDLDTKGKQIPLSALKDVREWCSVDFDAVHCGLTAEQAEKYNLPVNPEKPGQYQWESLEHEQAGEIINEALNTFWDEENFLKTKEKEMKAEKNWKTHFPRFLEKLKGSA